MTTQLTAEELAALAADAAIAARHLDVRDADAVTLHPIDAQRAHNALRALPRLLATVAARDREIDALQAERDEARDFADVARADVAALREKLAALEGKY